MAKILLVEDEVDLAGVVKDWLEEEELNLVEHAQDGPLALDMLSKHNYDLLILDLMLPGIDGMQVCREFRNRGGTIPILMLTARNNLNSKEAGLDAGADDYLTKPFHMREMAARVRALLRRRGTPRSSLSVADITLDRNSCTARKADNELHLLPKEFMLLEYLMLHENTVVSVDTLIDQIWGSYSSVTAETVRSNIKTLRKKIDTEGQASIIKNIYGMGYKLDSSG